MQRRSFPLVCSLVLAGCTTAGGTSMGTTAAAPPGVEAATQLLGPNGELHGSTTVSAQGGDTRVRARIEGMAAGTYAIHLHAVGRCEPPKFATAGAHFEPGTHLHGKDNPMGPHAGDLPNVVVGAGGIGSVDFTVAGLALTGPGGLLDPDGAAIVLHAGPDDYKTDPSGNSGDRIACGAFAARVVP